MFDALIIGGGVAGVSCALVLGSAQNKAFMSDKKIGILAHQKASMLQDAVINNAYGIPAGKLGSELLSESLATLTTLYPHIEQIHGEKILSIRRVDQHFEIVSNKASYEACHVVVAINSSAPITISGLEAFTEAHQKSIAGKNRIQLRNQDQLVSQGLYVAGTLAGHRSQVAIAAGSGAAVATDLLTLWNNDIPTHSHDSLRKK